MNFLEIKRAVDEGFTVCWETPQYVVLKSDSGETYYIHSLATNHSIGITHADGYTLNGKEEEFFVHERM